MISPPLDFREIYHGRGNRRGVGRAGERQKLPWNTQPWIVHFVTICGVILGALLLLSSNEF